MRRRLTVGAVLVALGLALWLGMRAGPEAAGQPPPHRPSLSSIRRTSSVLSPGTSPAATPPRGALHIQGTVHGPDGPLPGVTVVATTQVPGETLSARPCLEDARKSLLECESPKVEGDVPLMELLLERQGEALEEARAMSAADGTFTLEGLSPGPHAVWAEGASGVAMLRDVHAGTEGVELRLVPGWPLTGHVRDEAGAPLPQARITAIHRLHSRFFETLSGEDGRFRLGPLPPGPYLVLFSQQGRLPAVEQVDGNGEELNATLSRERRLSGRVVHEGQPVAGAQVHVEGHFGFELDLSTVEVGPRDVLTDAQGRFTFSGLRRGTYELTALRDEQGAAARVSLDQEDTEAVMELGTSFHLEGLVRDEAGHPIEGAIVTFKMYTREPFSVELRHTTTDARGRYWLGPLTRQTGQLAVSAKHYVDVEQSVEVSRRSARWDVTLRSAVLVEGRVVDARGEPLRDVGLYLDWVGEPSMMPVPWPLRGDSSDADGRFSLDAPIPGPYTLMVTGGALQVPPLRVMAPTRQLRVVVARGAAVTGRLLEEAGSPVHRAEIRVFSPRSGNTPLLDLEKNTFVDLQGRFRLEHLTPGRYLLQALGDPKTSIRHSTRWVEVKEEEEVEAVLHLPPGHPLSGQVVDTEGRPIEGARVSAAALPVSVPGFLNALPPAVMRTQVDTDAQGRFTFQDVSVEEVLLSAHLPLHEYEPALGTGGTQEGHWRRIRTHTPEIRLVLRRQSEAERLEEEERLFEPDLEPNLYSVP